MNKVLITIIFSCVLFNSAFGQFDFGVRAGMNLTNWDTRGHNTLTAFHAGGVVQYEVTEFFSLNGELIYSGKGTDLSEYIPSNPMTFRLQYLSLPLMVGFHVKQVTFKIGPEVSYLVGSGIEINDKEQDVPEAFKKWDWSAAAGATLQIVDGLSLEVRYIYGFDDVVELFFVDENGQGLGKLDQGKNRVLQLGLSYYF